MAIDFDVVDSILTNMAAKLYQMSVIVSVKRDGKVTIPELGDRTFSVVENTQLKDKYLSLKTELQVLYQSLP